MHICFLADANSIHTHRWIAPLVERGFRITLVSYTPVKRDLGFSYPVIDLPKMVNWPRVRFLVWGLWLRAYLRRLKPDILHAHQLQAAGWLGVITGYHPFITSSWGSDLLVEPQRSKFRRRLVKTVLDRSDRLVYTSPPQLDAARSLGYPLDKMRLIPWGVETGVFRPSPRDRALTRQRLGIDLDTPLVFSPRGIAPIYQIHKIIQAFEQVRKDCPEARLLLLKSSYQPAYLAELEDFIRDHNMQSNVIWFTQDRNFEMEPMAVLYRAADVTVSFPTSEGYGLTVFEAIACGCPTVISDIRTFDDVLQDQVHTLKAAADDTQALAGALTRLLASPALRESISKNALVLVDDLSVETRITKTIALYNEFAVQP
jgi:glycosyltransferase involved in cell wall biosynthesis